MTQLLLELLVIVPMAAVAIILHELAHGYAALALGDETALKAGRLSLNPLRHVDRTGTLIFPGILLASQLLTVGRVLFMFGWAKPVPVDPSHFRAPRQMMALVALAGPLMNITLAFLAAHLYRLPHLAPGFGAALDAFIDLNLALAIFNLFPLPPLDGGRIAVGLLPLRLAKLWAGLEPYGLVVILLLIAGPPLLRTQGIDIDPLGTLLGPPMNGLLRGILWLAGVQNGAI